MKCALYRHFNAAGELLYVGISLSPTTRLYQHRSGARWFREISSVTVEWFDCRQFAETAERQAIKSEKPRYNIAHADNQKPVAKTGRYWVHEIETGRYDGCYFDSVVANEMLQFYRAEYPSFTHRLVTSVSQLDRENPDLKPRCIENA
jgi:predicted GIY-YIG superfamily endonuclease